MNCASAPRTSASAPLILRRRWSSRWQRRKCCKSLVVLQVICSLSLRRCWRTRFASATPRLEIFSVGKVKVCILLPLIIRPLLLPKSSGVYRCCAPAQAALLVACWRPKHTFMSSIFWQSRLTLKKPLRMSLQPRSLEVHGRSWPYQCLGEQNWSDSSS